MESSYLIMSNKIAVIIPVFNTEKYIRECLDSVLGQTWTDLTVYAVNDGSSDKSGEILDSYAKKDSRIHVIHKSNGGASCARNVALDAIYYESNEQFEFIHFFDSDDILDSAAYETAIHLMNLHSADYAMLPVMRFDQKGTLDDKSQSHLSVLSGQNEIASCFFQQKAFSSNLYRLRGLGNKIFRANLLLDIRFNLNLEKTEDQDLFLRILPKLKKGLTVPDHFLHYRQRNSSLCHQSTSNGDLQVFSELYFHPLEQYSELTNQLIQHNYIKSLINEYLQALLNDSQNTKYLANQAKALMRNSKYRISFQMKRKLLMCLLPRVISLRYANYRIKKKTQQKQEINNFE